MRFETASIHSQDKTAPPDMKLHSERITVHVILHVAPSLHEQSIGFSSRAWRAIYSTRKSRRYASLTPYAACR
jgi:hypothetical protein